MSDDNRKSEIEAQDFFDEAFGEAERQYGDQTAYLGWLRHVRAKIGRGRGDYLTLIREKLGDRFREPDSEQSEAVNLESGNTVRTVIYEAAVKGLSLAQILIFLELEEYGIGVVGSIGEEAIEQGAKAYSRAIGTIHHTGHDDDNTMYRTLLPMSEEEQLREQESLPLNVWMSSDNGSPDEEAARRHGYHVQYSHHGMFRYVEYPDDGSVPPTWVDEPIGGLNPDD